MLYWLERKFVIFAIFVTSPLFLAGQRHGLPKAPFSGSRFLTKIEQVQGRCAVESAKKPSFLAISCSSADEHLLVHVRCPLINTTRTTRTTRFSDDSCCKLPLLGYCNFKHASTRCGLNFLVHSMVQWRRRPETVTCQHSIRHAQRRRHNPNLDTPMSKAPSSGAFSHVRI